MVKAVQVNDIGNSSTPGAYEFIYSNKTGGIVGLEYVCPCGCGVHGYLAFRYTDQPEPNWEWNGDHHKPTLNPSVHHLMRDGKGGTVTHWHGWLREGEWVSC